MGSPSIGVNSYPRLWLKDSLLIGPRSRTRTGTVYRLRYPLAVFAQKS
jgi:hypothetical protein